MDKAEQILIKSEKKKPNSRRQLNEENLHFEKQILSHHMIQSLLDTSSISQEQVKPIKTSPSKKQFKGEQQQLPQSQNLFENAVINALFKQEGEFQDESHRKFQEKVNQMTNFVPDYNNISDNYSSNNQNINNIRKPRVLLDGFNPKFQNKLMSSYQKGDFNMIPSFKDKYESMRYGSVPRFLKEIRPPSQNISSERPTLDSSNSRNGQINNHQAKTGTLSSFNNSQIAQNSTNNNQTNNNNNNNNNNNSTKNINVPSQTVTPSGSPQNQIKNIVPFVSVPLSVLLTPPNMNYTPIMKSQNFVISDQFKSGQRNLRQISPSTINNSQLQNLIQSPKLLEKSQTQAFFQQKDSLQKKLENPRPQRCSQEIENEQFRIKRDSLQSQDDVYFQGRLSDQRSSERYKISRQGIDNQQRNNMSYCKEQVKLGSLHLPLHNPFSFSEKEEKFIQEQKEDKYLDKRIEKILLRQQMSSKKIMKGGKFTSLETLGTEIGSDQGNKSSKIDEQGFSHYEQSHKRKSSLLPSHLRIVTTNQSIVANMPLPSSSGLFMKYSTLQQKGQTPNYNYRGSQNTNISDSNNNSSSINQNIFKNSIKNEMPNYSPSIQKSNNNKNNNNNSLPNFKNQSSLATVESIMKSQLLQNQRDYRNKTKTLKSEPIQEFHLKTDASDQPLPPVNS